MTRLLISIFGVLAVAGLVWFLGLGKAKLQDASQAQRLAEDMVPGFDARDVLLSSDMESALIAGRNDQFVLLKRHGAKFAARALNKPLNIARDENQVIVDSGEMTFGAVALSLSKADTDKLLAMVQASAS